MTREVEVGGQKYRIGKMEPMVQLHVARRLVPLLPAVGSFMKLLGEMRGKPGGLLAYLSGDLSKAIDMATPLLEAVGKLSDEDFNYVCAATLNVTHRFDSNRWVRVTPVNDNALTLAYDDIGAVELVQLVVQAIQEGLARFFSAAPSSTLSGSPAGQA